MGLAVYNGFSPKLREASYEWLKAEIASGRVRSPQRCQVCGEHRGWIDWHCESYAHPFGTHIYAYELCFRCHMMVHTRFRFPDRWQRYIAQLEAGVAYEPLMSRREIGLLSRTGWVDNPLLIGPKRPRLDFFRGLSLVRAPERLELDRQGVLF
jgi:hypothetical protein